MTSSAQVIVGLVCLLGVIILSVLGFMIVIYNSLVRLRNTKQESWRQVDVELQRRHDLVPQLVEITVASAEFERSTLDRVITARNHAVAASQNTSALGIGPTTEVSQAEGNLGETLRGFFALAESYPTLRSNQNFIQLQSELANTENRIAAGRRFYNANVRDLNIKVETVPSNVIASLTGFSKAEYFEIGDSAATLPSNLGGVFNRFNLPQE